MDNIKTTEQTKLDIHRVTMNEQNWTYTKILNTDFDGIFSNTFEFLDKEHSLGLVYLCLWRHIDTLKTSK